MDRVGDPHGPRHGTGVGPGVGLAGLLEARVLDWEKERFIPKNFHFVEIRN